MPFLRDISLMWTSAFERIIVCNLRYTSLNPTSLKLEILTLNTTIHITFVRLDWKYIHRMLPLHWQDMEIKLYKNGSPEHLLRIRLSGFIIDLTVNDNGRKMECSSSFKTKYFSAMDTDYIPFLADHESLPAFWVQQKYSNLKFRHRMKYEVHSGLHFHNSFIPLPQSTGN